MRLQTLLFFGLLILLSSSAWAITGLPSVKSIQYNPNDLTDTLDWYNPTEYGASCSGTTPIIIWAHGGGFTAGNSIIGYGIDRWKTLLQNCYAVASLNYTLSPTQSMVSNPIMPFDFARAVQYFRKNDTNFNINENKIIAMGQSAGADIWMYPVFGPDMNIYTVQDDLNIQNTRPNYFVSIAGWTDINAMINTTTGALYNQPTLATVSSADKNKMSMISMLDTNAPLYPDRIVPTLFLCNGASSTTLPITDPHDCYFGDIGLAKINQFNPNTGSQDINIALYADDTTYILDWLNNNVGNANSDNPTQLTYINDFNGYNDQYVANGSYSILYDFNQQTGWTIGGDFNNGFFVPGFGGKLNRTAISWPLDMDKNATNASSIYRTIPRNSVLRDWNATGAYLYILWKTDQNVEMAYIQLGLGQNLSNYEIWRKSASTGWIQPWGNGWNLLRYDLNSPFPGKVGSPSFLDVNFMQITVAYTGSQVDFNFTVDRVWTENYPGSMGDAWNIPIDGNKLYGWAMPFNDNNKTGLVVTDLNTFNTNNYGIALLNEFSDYDLTTFDFNVQVDINQVNTVGTKILFDYIDPNNYSSCFITDLNATGRSIGVEQVVNGLSSNTSTTTNFAYQTSATYICQVSGSTVSVYKDGSLLIYGTGFDRTDGSFGLASIGGTSNFQNYELSLLSIESTPSDSEDQVFSTSLNALSQVPGLLVIAGLILILIFGIYVLTNPNQSVSLPASTDSGVMIVVYVALAIIIILFTVIISSYAITIT